MRPGAQLKFKPSNDGAILVSGLGHTDFRINGSSMPNSATDQSKYVDVATFTAPSDKKSYGVLAIYARDHDSKKEKNISFLLAITWKDGKPDIDEQSPWVSPADRLGQAYYDCVSVKVGDVVYISSEEVAKKHGYKYVPDGNLICKFLAKDVELDALEKAVQEVEKKKSKQEKLVESLENARDALTNQLELSKVLHGQEIQDLQKEKEFAWKIVRQVDAFTRGPRHGLHKRLREYLVEKVSPASKGSSEN